METGTKVCEVRAWRTRQMAQDWIKLQGWTRKAVVRMFHWPEHRFANERGNVPVVRVDTALGYQYEFEHGKLDFLKNHGQPFYQWMLE